MSDRADAAAPRLGRLLRTASFRLALGASGILAGASLVQLGLVWWQSGRFETARIDRLLADAAGSLAREAPADIVWHVGVRWSPTLRSLPIAALFASDGRRLAGNVDAVPADLPADGTPHAVTAYVAGRPVAIRAIARRLAPPLGAGQMLVIGRDMRELGEVRRIVLRAVVLGFLPALLLALAGGAVLGHRALLRVGDMHRAVETIMAGRLDRRLPAGGTGDDLDLLAGSVNRMLDRIERLLGEVRGVGDDIAHDLRTPLARVRATLDRTRGRALPPEALHAAIERAIGELDRLFAVITALLRIAEIESGRRRAGFAGADLREIAADAVELYEPVAEAADITLRLAPGEGDAAIEADRDLLMEAVANLLDNAIKFTPAGGHVTVAIEPRTISVTDDGIGMSDEERGAVTKRFYRADRSRHVPGSGLGLSLVAAIADLHAATLEIRSGPTGSRFALVFPERRAEVRA